MPASCFILRCGPWRDRLLSMLAPFLLAYSWTTYRLAYLPIGLLSLVLLLRGRVFFLLTTRPRVYLPTHAATGNADRRYSNRPTIRNKPNTGLLRPEEPITCASQPGLTSSGSLSYSAGKGSLRFPFGSFKVVHSSWSLLSAFLFH